MRKADGGELLHMYDEKRKLGEMIKQVQKDIQNCRRTLKSHKRPVNPRLWKAACVVYAMTQPSFEVALDFLRQHCSHILMPVEEVKRLLSQWYTALTAEEKFQQVENPLNAEHGRSQR